MITSILGFLLTELIVLSIGVGFGLLAEAIFPGHFRLVVYSFLIIIVYNCLVAVYRLYFEEQ